MSTYTRLARYAIASSILLTPIVSEGQIAIHQNRGDVTQRDYNLRIGEAELSLGSGLQLTYDSNFNRASNNTAGGSYAIAPSLQLGVYWPISPYITFDTNISIGYQFYVSGPGEDGLRITGLDGLGTASTFNLEFLIGDDSLINVYNSLSATIDTVQTGATAGGGTSGNVRNEPFQQYTYVAGIGYVQRLTPYTRLNVNYDFQLRRTPDSTFNYINRITNTPSVSVAHQLNQNLTGSLTTSANFYDYSEDLHNNGFKYLFGGGLEYITDGGLIVGGELGVEYLDFSTSNDPAATDADNVSPYANGYLQFKTGEFLTHTFSGKYTHDASNGSFANPANPSQLLFVNFQLEYGGAYTLSIPIRENINVYGSYNLYRIEQSDNGNKYNRQGVLIGADYDLSKQINVSVRYTYENAFDATFVNTDYNRNLVDIFLNYNF
ncbi:hypothetical protein [Rubellicoccus peritrichatus]|uniref:Uncharacterized protein n=1 Tax=Rubellicoccus peritrichatus TaxID=3080537 RepID=A0AAQ3QVB7_9BACT|nr:hypothetical protein [Puniceicoccus sp. CR14]WOO41418.1 hypothetical protein RZN69_22590 [Puniceicoccus sp. CR14]